MLTQKILAAILLSLAWGVEESRADLFFPQIAAGGGFATTVTLIHTDARSTAGAASGTLSFYNPDGSPRTVNTAELGSGSSFNVTIPVGGVRVVTITSTGDVAIGAARFGVSGGVSVGGVATFTSGAAIVGVNAVEATNFAYIPLNTSPGFDNGVAIQNTSAEAEKILFFLLNPDGSTDQESPTVLNLPVNGQYSKIVGPEMGFTGPVKPNATLLVATYFDQAAVNPSFGVLPLVIGNGLISSGAIVTQDQQDIQDPIFFPQVVDGSGDTTVFRIVNPFSSTAAGKISFFNQDGSPRNMGIVGQGKASVFPFSLVPGGTLVLQTDGTSPAVGVGMARVDSTSPLGGVSTIYLGSVHIGVPSSLPMRSARIAINTSNGMNTGFALANVGAAAANLKLTLQDRQGSGAQTVQQSVLNPLAVNGQAAEFATEVGFSGATGRTDSSILIEPNGAGTFVPLALLESNGVFSTTATARQRIVDAASLPGKYTGNWTLPTAGISGVMTFTIGGLSSGLGSMTVTATTADGSTTLFSVFGAGNFTSDGELITTGGFNSRLRPDGVFSAFVSVPPPPTAGPIPVSDYVIAAEYTGTKFAGTLLIGYADGSIESGSFSLTKQ
jgi:hypothetical protein